MFDIFDVRLAVYNVLGRDVSLAIRGQTMTELEKILVAYFEHQGWAIVTDDDRLEAELPSGYGSGPAVIDLRDLAQCIGLRWKNV